MAEQSDSGKKALLIGVVLGLACAGLGAYTMSESKVSSVNTSVRSSSGKNTLDELAVRVKAEMSLDRTLADAAPEGAVIGAEKRLTPLFFSPELWQVSNASQKRNVVIDIYDPANGSIHEGIPNDWFITNGIRESLAMSDGAERDDDGDGFSNREEFEAGTKPADAASYPALMGKSPKLAVQKKVTNRAVLTADAGFAYAQNPEDVNIRIFNRMTDIDPAKRQTVKVGESFGLGFGDAKRYTVKGFEPREFTDIQGNKVTEMTVVLTDNDPYVKDKEFALRAGKPRESDRDLGTPTQKGRSINDTNVTFVVTAGSKKDTSFRVPVGGTFKIPGDIADTSCVLETVDSSGSANVRVSGAESPVNIPKAN